MKIVFATGNQNKLREIREILGDTADEILSMKEAGIDADPEETGATFEENALIKARACAELLRGRKDAGDDVIVLADDSGLEIDAMGGEPGIRSARFLGHETSYDEKNRVILERMREVPEEERTARFVCAVAAVPVQTKESSADTSAVGAKDATASSGPAISPLSGEHVVRATMEGRIAHAIAGANGFGYDPIFFLPSYGKTSAEISPEEKNAISHRGKALRAMRKILLGETS